MRKFIPLLILTSLACISSGCSTLQFPGVYRVTIEQGNIITQEMVDELKPGMSREQVEFIMGSPLFKDTFNSDRWDYIYSIQRASEPREQYRLSIFFDAESLKYFTGDFVPTPADTPFDADNRSDSNTADSAPAEAG